MDVSMLPVRHRGCPSRLYSELALMHQYRGELNNAVTSSVLQSPESSSRDADVAEGASPERQHSTSSHSVSSEKGDECENRPSDDANPDEGGSLHWSVEMAAVNQAILSLTGQQPIGVAPPVERGDPEEACCRALNTPPPPTPADLM